MIAVFRWMLITVAASVLAFGGTSSERPVVLPPVNVAAGVPLKKVGEFDMLEARFAAAAVTDGRYIYIIGGQNPDLTVSRSVERFDIATGKSTEFGTLSTGRMWHRAVVVGDRAYILGGAVPCKPHEVDESQRSFIGALRSQPLGTSGGRYVPPSSEDWLSLNTADELPPIRLDATVEVLDLRTGSVSVGPKMPEARSDFGCVCISGRIYVMGGKHFRRRSVSATNRVLVLDVLTGAWSDGVPTPHPAIGDAVVVTGPFIVTVGGYDGNRKARSVYAFNPLRGAWTSLPEAVRSVSAHGTVFVDKYLFCFGDYDNPDEILVYDLVKKESEVFTLQYRAARNSAVVVVGKTVFVIGGKAQRSDEPLRTIQLFALVKGNVE